MKIKVTASPSEISERTFEFELSDIGLTKEEWKFLSKGEQKTLLQSQLDGLPEQPYWGVDNYWTVE